MKVVIAIDSFKGSMTSLEAGESAAAGIRRVYPDADIRIRPLADGGEGTVDALTMGCGGRLQKIRVTGPLGRPVDSVSGRKPDRHYRNVLCSRYYPDLGKRTESASYDYLWCR